VTGEPGEVAPPPAIKAASIRPTAGLRLAPSVVDVARPDDHRRRYVLACAAISAAGQVLVESHRLTGAPGPVTVPEQWPDLELAAYARSAAGAMSLVGGRLMTLVRDHDGHRLPGLRSPARPQPGVTVPDTSDAEEWRATVRCLASALAECEVALTSCEAVAPKSELERSLLVLRDIAGQMVGLMERTQLSK
jgi:hypothetical protein